MPGWVLTILIVLALFVGLGFLRVGLHASYIQSQPSVQARIAGFSVPLYPPRPKKTDTHKKRRDKQNKQDKLEKDDEQEDSSDLLSLLTSLLAGIRRAWRPLLRGIHLRVHASVIAASPDAAHTAMLYGRFCAACGALIPLLDMLFTLKLADVSVNADFDRTTPLVQAELALSASVGRLLLAGILFLSAYLSHQIKNSMKKDRSGQTKKKAVQSS